MKSALLLRGSRKCDENIALLQKGEQKMPSHPSIEQRTEFFALAERVWVWAALSDASRIEALRAFYATPGGALATYRAICRSWG